MMRAHSWHRLHTARLRNPTSTRTPVLVELYGGLACAAGGSRPRGTHRDGGAATGKLGPGETR